MKALTVRQPWAWLAAQIPMIKDLEFGKIIGTVNMVDCVRKHPSPFFQGKFGFVFENARLVERPVLVCGALGLWDWDAPASVFMVQA